ncbi:hypothetical protein OESDEN_10450 [Oesophagostomum dentatum]|uniref:SCP domain-containing protein n=1 Tax=Oesophagostomum dentatum TaxID=61180 RepID=A0A0B1SWR5_OESDE|nr:hypothetical protein OESDEN_10450 [Oesophagostomum dentatum]
MCQGKNQEMADSLRKQFLNTHNYRRSVLALGQIRDAYGGITLPKAKNMCQLSWRVLLLPLAFAVPKIRSRIVLFLTFIHDTKNA